MQIKLSNLLNLVVRYLIAAVMIPVSAAVGVAGLVFHLCTRSRLERLAREDAERSACSASGGRPSP